MPRELSRTEAEQVWQRLNHRLVAALEGDPGAYPDRFEARLEVAAWYLPDAPFLAAIREAMEAVGDTALLFLASEYAQAEAAGLDWEVPASELTVPTLTGISHSLECYLVSPTDQWAVYFHHEGVAYCGGTLPFIRALAEACTRHGVPPHGHSSC